MLGVEQIQALIQAGLPGADVVVESADGVHFHATVRAPQFAGLSMLQQHKQVYTTLREHLDGEAIHALALTTQVNNVEGDQ